MQIFRVDTRRHPNLDVVCYRIQIAIDELFYTKPFVFVLVDERCTGQAVQKTVVTVAPQGLDVVVKILLGTFDVLEKVLHVCK